LNVSFWHTSVTAATEDDAYLAGYDALRREISLNTAIMLNDYVIAL
jgi:hypothetical protein